MKEKINYEEIKQLFRNEKSIKIILIIGAVIIIFIALGGITPSRNNQEAKLSLFNYEKQAEYEKELEVKLADILSQIEGIGKIDIMITLDTSEETTYINNKDDPTCIKTPLVRGVIVVCDGGDDVIIKQKVINAVSGAFGISTTRISVIK